ncbi:MAG: hypothetical protein K6B75_05705, partial [Lachnospiraceae bacterium]|nr:hypothetical protein [Lachnospiraceae bacterium]
MAEIQKNVDATPAFSAMAKRNKNFLTCTTIIEIVLILAYLLEVVKGARTIGYVLSFGLVFIIPLAYSIYTYKTDAESDKIKWVIGISYFVGWGILYFTGLNYMIVLYIVPMLLAVLMFNNQRLTMVNSGLSLVMVLVVSIYNYTALGMNSPEDLQMLEISIAAIVLISVFNVFVIKVNGEIQAKNDEIIEADALKQEELLQTVAATVEELNASMDTAADYGADTLEHNDALGTAMKEVAKGAEEMATSLQSQMHLMSDVQTNVDNSTEKTDEVVDRFGDVKKAVGNGITKMEGIIKGNHETTQALSETAVSMEELIGKVEAVHKLLDVINEIQAQTSLLSLNASIEAARAG